MPPATSALLLYFEPNLLPITTPPTEIRNVVKPIMVIDGTILTFRKANVIPTASASILVAMAGQLFLSNKHLTKLQNCDIITVVICFRSSAG